MKDLPDFQAYDLLSPHFLFVVLPLMILLCPFNPCAVAAHEFKAARAAHFELSGQLLGAKNAAVNMEARGVGASHLLRKMVVSKAEDLTPKTFDSLLSSGTGGLLLLLPAQSRVVSSKAREAIMIMEEHITSQDVEVPIYFAEESEELLQLEADLKADVDGAKVKSKSGAQAILDGIISNGFQIVSTAGNPKMLSEQSLPTIQGYLPGKTEPENLPTILVVAHYDAGGAAPNLAFGADSNGSGVSILMELARIFGDLYKAGGDTHADYNLVFLLTGGGKVNYYGSKKWLEDQRDFQDQQKSDFLSNVNLVVCLDSLGQASTLNLHVSKPPKEGTSSHKFLSDLQATAQSLYGSVKVDFVHKKINLAQDLLAWEHERYSIAKLSALTMSHLPAHSALSRSSITDLTVDQDVLKRNTHLLASALACTVYSKCPVEDKVKEALLPKAESLQAWTEKLAETPRGASLLTGAKNVFAKYLLAAMDKATMKAKLLLARRDKRDADYTFYDIPEATINSYSIKPAVFDLVLTLFIAAYLGGVYVLISNAAAIFGFLASLTVAAPAATAPSSPSKRATNGKSKAH